MRRVMLKSKIHRATITGSDLNYVGSITIDPDLLEAADILEHEQVHVLDVDNGARFETYTIAGVRGSGAPSAASTESSRPLDSTVSGVVTPCAVSFAAKCADGTMTWAE